MSDYKIRFKDESFNEPRIKSGDLKITIRQDKLKILKNKVNLSSNTFFSNQIQKNHLNHSGDDNRGQKLNVNHSGDDNRGQKLNVNHSGYDNRGQKLNVNHSGYDNRDQFINEDFPNKDRVISHKKDNNRIGLNKNQYDSENFKQNPSVNEPRKNFKNQVATITEYSNKFINESHRLLNESVGNDEAQSLYGDIKKNTNISYQYSKRSFRHINDLSNKTNSNISYAQNGSKLAQRVRQITKKKQLQIQHSIKSYYQYFSTGKALFKKNSLKNVISFISSNPYMLCAIAVILVVILLVPIAMLSVATPTVISIQTEEEIMSDFHLFVSELDYELKNYIIIESMAEDENAVIKIDNISTNSFDLMAYFSTQISPFKMKDVENQVRQIHNELYQVEKRTIDGRLYVNVISKSVHDYITLNKTSLFAKGSYDNYLVYRQYGTLIYQGEISHPYDVSYAFSSTFGYRRHPLTSVKDLHTGLDIPQVENTPINAVMDGVVTKVGYDEDGYGNYVVISNGDVETLYGHCNSILVTKGQPVSIGDKIALTGSTGASTGSHLHLEYKKNGKYLNPEYYLPVLN